MLQPNQTLLRWPVKSLAGCRWPALAMILGCCTYQSACTGPRLEASLSPARDSSSRMHASSRLPPLSDRQDDGMLGPGSFQVNVLCLSSKPASLPALGDAVLNPVVVVVLCERGEAVVGQHALLLLLRPAVEQAGAQGLHTSQ